MPLVLAFLLELQDWDRLFRELEEGGPEARAELLELGDAAFGPLTDRIARERDPARKAALQEAMRALRSAHSWRAVERLLKENVELETAQRRIFDDLRSDDPKRMERGLVALGAGLSFEPPVKNTLALGELEQIIETALSGVQGGRWNPLKGSICVWARSRGARGLGGLIAPMLDEPDLRLFAMSALGGLGLKEHAGAVERFLDDADRDARAAASEALIQMGAAGSLKKVLARLEADPGRTPAVAGAVLAYLPGYEAALAGLLDDPQAAHGALAVLLALDKTGPVAPRVVAWLADARQGRRDLAEEALVRAERDDLQAAIVELIGHPTPEARYHALRTAGRLRLAGAADAAADRLRDRVEFVQNAALTTLGLLDSKRHAGAVAHFLEAPSEGLRRAAVDAIGRLRAENRADAVEALLRDPDEGVRGRAALALAWLGDARARGPLRALLAAGETKTQHERAEALLVLNRLRAPEAFEKLASTPRPADLRRGSVWDVVQWICAETRLAAEFDPSLAARSRTALLERLPRGSLLDMLWEMSYWECAFVLEPGRLRVVPRRAAYELWAGR